MSFGKAVIGDANTARLCERVPSLTYLSTSAPIRLHDGTALLGVDN